MSSTTKCVVCLKEGKLNFGGHVHKGDEIVIAAVCNEHLRTTLNNGCKGCYGEWKEEMGYDESFGMLMYIDNKGLHKL